MKLFQKRESLVQNIAYMGIMAAINVIFVVMTYFVPFLLFVLLFVLPLCSAIISFYCKKIYFPIYLIVVSAICLLIDLSDTIFYVIPSLLTGFVFGLLLDKKIPTIFIIVAVTLLQFGITLASIPLIKVMTNRDIVNDIAVLFHVNENIYLDYLKYGFIYFVSFVQTFISFLVLHSELNKFGIQFVDQVKKGFVIDIITISLVGLSILFGFVFPVISYLVLFTAFLFLIYRLMFLDYSHYKIYIIVFIISILATIFLVAILYPYINKPLGLLSLGLLPVLISIACLITNCLLSKRNKDTIIE